MFQPPVNEDGSVAPSPSLEFTKVEDISCRLVSLTCLTNIIEEETNILPEGGGIDVCFPQNLQTG